MHKGVNTRAPLRTANQYIITIEGTISLLTWIDTWIPTRSLWFDTRSRDIIQIWRHVYDRSCCHQWVRPSLCARLIFLFISLPYPHGQGFHSELYVDLANLTIIQPLTSNNHVTSLSVCVHVRVCLQESKTSCGLVSFRWISSVGSSCGILLIILSHDAWYRQLLARMFPALYDII